MAQVWRSRVALVPAVLLTTTALSACVGTSGERASTRRAPPAVAVAPAEATPAPAPAPAAAAGERIGAGSVKVALVVPLTGQGAAIGTAMRNAAQLAYEDAQQPDLAILVEDDRGTPPGALEGTERALKAGADLILGPLFAGSVRSASYATKNAGKPMIAFSTDVGVASPGVYLLSFQPQPEVARIVSEEVASGRRSFAALIPDTAYGNAVEAQFREAVTSRGARVAAIERYPAGAPDLAVKQLAAVIVGRGATADALFIPETADGLAAVAAALAKAGFSPERVRPIGTAPWNEPALFALPALQGGRFAAPDQSGFAGFSGRYQARFGASPPRVASLAYDAVMLSAALSRQFGSQRFAESTLTNASGFAGIDGTFRFHREGTSDRSLAVYEIRNNAVSVVSPATRVLPKPGL